MKGTRPTSEPLYRAVPGATLPLTVPATRTNKCLCPPGLACLSSEKKEKKNPD